MARRDLFTSIRSEGALLPAAFLQRLADPAQKVDGTSPESYHLSGEKLGEAASRSWNHLLACWKAFQAAREALPKTDPATTVTREKWLLPLFQELGYGRLAAAKAVEIDGKAYPVSHTWRKVPIHLVGCQVELDRPTAGVAGAARSSPHSLVQEFLNRSSDHLWAFVGNGDRLRLLRDNKSFTRQAFVEFDLAGMMDGQVYADFVLLYMLAHQSRVEAERPEECWLERWSERARQEGIPALERLREGVEKAIVALGRGFLGNAALREKLRAGTLDKQDYYRQLLRVVYRLIFLFVAEDRELLLAPGAAPEAKKCYVDFYSARRLRTLAERRRGSPHVDLWRMVSLVFAKLGASEDCPELGLPALNSFLWSDRATPDLDGLDLANADLLEAVRALAFRVEGRVRQAVDYKNLGAEELGSVYEALLELHPEIHAEAGEFGLGTAGGHERKTTGSYYTPTSLVSCLLKSALDPVLKEAAGKPEPEQAILGLRVCDPACGSGHFLIAAAHRIAKRLAGVRTGDDEPSPDAIRTALRDVIGHCLYGVDVNPMAVELCKVNLWLEALEPGKPLSFLDHRIQCGNSLLGTSPALIAAGIPEDAFQPIEGDDKASVTIYRKRNRAEHGGQQSLLSLPGRDPLGMEALVGEVGAIDRIDDSSIAGIQEKTKRWSALEASAARRGAQLVANAWCAAFVCEKRKGALMDPITERTFRDIEASPQAVDAKAAKEIERLAQSYAFFHWDLAFPDVFRGAGGFDVVLGNPPWEKVKLVEKEFFAERDPEIAAAPNAAARARLIKALKADDPLFLELLGQRRQAEGASHFIRRSGRYPLCGVGDVNTYAVFAELNRSLIGPHGRAGFIVPTGIATDDTTKAFFADLVRSDSVATLYGFENEGKLFAGIDHRVNFCILCIASGARSSARFAWFLRHPTALADPERTWALKSGDLALLNPNTRTCPIFRTRRDAEITKAIYRRVPVLVEEAKGEAGNPWGVTFLAMFHMANDSGLFRTREGLEAEGATLRGNVFETGQARHLPLYEAKMLHQFDHRYGDFSRLAPGQSSHILPTVPPEDRDRPGYAPMPRYWVQEDVVGEHVAGPWPHCWFLGWRRVTDSRSSERTVVASLLPRAGAGDSVFLLLPSETVPVSDVGCLLACMNSFPSDYVARQKLGGVNLLYYIMRQLPVPSPSAFEATCSWGHATSLADWIRPRALELTYTAWDLQPFARDLGYAGPPFRWDPERRFQLRCELDAAFFHLYGIPRDDVGYIMDTFPIVRRNDEKAHGEYRTKRVILDIYDRMLEAIHAGRPYETILEPPPADRGCAHPNEAV